MVDHAHRAFLKHVAIIGQAKCRELIKLHNEAPTLALLPVKTNQRGLH